MAQFFWLLGRILYVLAHDHCKLVSLLYLFVLGDYFILANSTFSYWAMIFSRCRKLLSGWWAKAFKFQRTRDSLEIFVAPYRQDRHVELGLRSSTFDLIAGPFLYPNTVPLFEIDSAWNQTVADFFQTNYQHQSEHL